MKHAKILLIGALVLLLFTAGCNLFGFANPSSSSTSNLADGQRKYWDGEFEEAVELFAKAKENDPDNADAYWWHAKALLRATGNTAISLVTAMSEIESDSQDEIPLPFMDETDWPDGKADTLYQAMFGIKSDLAMIYSGNVQSDELNEDAVGLDYASTLVIQSALMFRDTDVNDTINEFDININDLLYFINNGFNIDSTIWLLENVDVVGMALNIGENLDSLGFILDPLLGDDPGFDIDQLDSLMDMIDIEIDSLLADTTGGN
ncbi:MAG: hypothetical protein J7K40_02340 [candidate division Zixibacteria bacterium]|nr:hypothetical protein [candidate division Zixibacteria bacterium]